MQFAGACIYGSDGRRLIGLQHRIFARGFVRISFKTYADLPRTRLIGGHYAVLRVVFDVAVSTLWTLGLSGLRAYEVALG